MPLTIEEYVRFLAPGLTELDWPPDVFALAMSVLQRSGAYCIAVEEWPPLQSPAGRPSGRAADDWVRSVRAVSQEWRRRLSEKVPGPPRRIKELWTCLRRGRMTTLAEVRHSPELAHALLELAAIADEASAGGGVTNRDKPSFVETLLDAQITRANTLCKQVPASRVRVYPKLHTPQSGLTTRSLSHHLALLEPGEVTPLWRRLSYAPPRRAMNLLVMPWPSVVHPSQFREVAGRLENMPPEFGFFEYSPRALDEQDLAALRNTIQKAAHENGNIDLVVFPECAVRDSDFDALREIVCEEFESVLIAGTAKPDARGVVNAARIAFASGTAVPALPPQHKHHRWQLDRNQIMQYGLGHQLDPGVRWWEATPVEARELNFMQLTYWLTMSVLICEDLARQDPVSELVRAVGPNLVIALLLDGPQLAARWPARYATVLADDPGSSVLTVTSLGMSELCRPGGLPPCRTVALWKDGRGGGPREISLPPGAAGVVLCLANEAAEDWTADGRSDGKTTYYPILAGVHPVFPASRPELD